jgi:hypothetical protein
MPLISDPPTALRGIVLREEADALVVQATPEEVRRFMADRAAERTVEVRRRPPRAIDLGPVSSWHTWHNWHTTHTTGDDRQERAPRLLRMSGGSRLLYNEDGVPVAVVRRASVEVDRVDVTSFGSSSPDFVAGEPRVRLDVVALPGLRLV